ncbi:uncharacterized protein [Choristoneura fumiferana]|uniref:uncharacterized protein n=1 Tax=Choristoneura fumiferana TaxID=7141 RepID=UPI003D15A7EF
MEKQYLYLIFLFLTVFNVGRCLTTNPSTQGKHLKGIHGDLSRRNQGYIYPVMNYDIRGRPFFPVLRQGQTGTTGVLSATTSATTVENEYIPYWPGGEWAMHRDPGYQKYCPEIVMKYGPVCGRKFHTEWRDAQIFMSFDNLCELERENWKGYRWNKSFYPVHLRHCRNTGGWSAMPMALEETINRKRKYEKDLWKKTTTQKTTTRNHG